MRKLFLASAVSIGCAASPPPASTLPAENTARTERITELEAQAQERDQEVRELRSRLALAQAEAEELRQRPVSSSARTETVRIRSEAPSEEGLLFFQEEGGEGSEWDAPAERLPEQQQARPDPRRPVLRLYGSPAANLPEAALRAPDLPSASLPPNPLTAMPPTPVMTPTWNTAPGSAPVAPMATAARMTPPRTSDAEYRAGLGALRSRNFDDALRSFDGFIRRAPTHPQAANARYWRAEVLYIQRRYSEARTAFRSYLRAHASGTKAPDALYKLALCHRRMGDEASARRMLEQLRRNHPNSVAARTASREAS